MEILRFAQNDNVVHKRIRSGRWYYWKCFREAVKEAVMRKYFLVPVIAAAALAGCSQLSVEDRSLINSATEAAQEARLQSMEASEQAKQATEEARLAREEAARAAAEAKAASEKVDRIFQTGSGK
jgi:uncharacterized lipoprotein YajG